MTSLFKRMNSAGSRLSRVSGAFGSDGSISSVSSVESNNSSRPYPALHWELCNVRFFHPHMNRNAAVHILLGTNKVGSYLLRNYSKGGPDDLTVSVRFTSDVKHFTVLWQGDGYLFGKHKFENLRKLLEHFDNMPIIGSQDDTAVGGASSAVLKYPYPRDLDIDDMAEYNAVATHQEFGARPADIHASNESLNDSDFEIRQKSGHLTKQGGRIKNWKNRWFVIEKHWLRYYVSKDSSSPRGVIDLSKATDCAADDSFSNGFTVKTPKRTYYIQSSTPEDRDSWVQMITWKLDYYNPARVAR